MITISNPSSTNAIALLTSSLGAFIRSTEEEKILLEHTKEYREYKSKVKCRFFNFILLIPIIFFIFSEYILNEHQTANEITIKSTLPPLSLIPYQYDDFGSVFIGNHIYRRLTDSNPQRPGILVNYSEIKIEKIKSGSRILFNIPSTIYDCENNLITQKLLKEELKEILNAKNWILPNSKFCFSKNFNICIETSKEVDVLRSLEAIYLRFGYSSLKNKKLIGIGPYCLKNEHPTHPIHNNQFSFILHKDFQFLKLKQFKVSTNKNLTNYDINLYSEGSKNSILTTSKRTHTPVGYYIVKNSNFYSYFNKSDLDKIISAIKSHLQDNGLLYESTLTTLFPSNTPETMHSLATLHKTTNSFLIPEYIDDCLKLKDNLNQQLKANVFYCSDPSLLIKKITSSNNFTWTAFLTPLIAGSPSRNSIYEQYFSPKSNDRWLKNSNINSSYQLVGTGDMLIDISSSSKIRSIKQNPLGLADLLVSDIEF